MGGVCVCVWAGVDGVWGGKGWVGCEWVYGLQCDMVGCEWVYGM